MAKISFEASLFDKRYDNLNEQELRNLERYSNLFHCKYTVAGELFEDEMSFLLLILMVKMEMYILNTEEKDQVMK